MRTGPLLLATCSAAASAAAAAVRPDVTVSSQTSLDQSTTDYASSLTCWEDTPCDARFVDTAFPGAWESNIFAPANRTVRPEYILVPVTSSTSSSAISFVPGPGDRQYQRMSLGGKTTSPLHLRGNGSQLVFDFGREVGGLVTLTYSLTGFSSSSGDAAIGLAFSESSLLVGEFSDASNGGFGGPDGALYANISATSASSSEDKTDKTTYTYTMPKVSLRGGFRYLTLFLLVASPEPSSAANVTVNVQSVSLDISFQPTWPNLRAYQGYFDCDDDLINRVWYAGAYTLQTNAIHPATGRHAGPLLSNGWASDALIGPGYTILVDGAKRDRTVWPGDMGVAVPSMILSTGDTESVKNALQAMYDNQGGDGGLPFAGPPLNLGGSDTYHLATMIGTYQYVLYTDDSDFLDQHWDGYCHAMAFITAKQTYASGLLEVTGANDWARFNAGANMTEAQALLYYALTTGAKLAEWRGDTSRQAAWTDAAAQLRDAVLQYCYDAEHGAFLDNAVPGTAPLYPQDANSMALAFGLVNDSDIRAASVSERLTDNWGSPFGPASPELGGIEVAPFAASFEVIGHLAVGEATRSLSLMRTLWGGYLNRADGTGSTMVEGLLVDDGAYAYRFDDGYGGPNPGDVDLAKAVAASYTSHSHGWSTGPTSALTEYVVGLAVTTPAGAQWQFAPQFGDLNRAEGGFMTPRGRFQAKWQLGGNRRGYTASVTTPDDTSGTLLLPVSSGNLRIFLDGTQLDATQYTLQDGVAEVAGQSGGFVSVRVAW